MPSAALEPHRLVAVHVRHERRRRHACVSPASSTALRIAMHASWNSLSVASPRL